MQFTGRILFLTKDPARVESQLAGRQLTLAQAGELRDDVSTDEITPLSTVVYFDQRLGRYPYTGVKCGDRLPLGVDAVRGGGFCVTVAGHRYGKGSSREHSPAAELRAGIRLVIAKSFERIYRQNADNLGLFTSTDFGLIERIERGETISVDDLVAGRDALTDAVLRAGGLLRFGAVHLRTRPTNIAVPATLAAIECAPPPIAAQAAPKKYPGLLAPQTFTEKILARHVLATANTNTDLRAGSGIFVRADWRFIHDIYTAMASNMLHETFGRPLALHEPETILTFEDHYSYVHQSAMHVNNGLLPTVQALSTGHRDFVRDYGLHDHGYLPRSQYDGGSQGISHALMAERYSLPGQIVVGTDSHTPHSGALGCLAFGVGTTDMANAMMTGVVRVTVPQSLRIVLDGTVPLGVTAKDLVLHLLALPAIHAGAGMGKVFEFTGSAASQLSTDERATITNMCAELGGFSGLFAPDDETVRFLRERRGIEFALEDWMTSDEGATYVETLTLDCSAVTPMIAMPGDPGNGVPLSWLGARTRIDIAYGGSCTAGKREDFDHYHAVLAWAAARGLRVHEHVKLFLQFGTVDVRDYCIERGYLAAFEAVGATLLQPACGACANCGPGTSTDAAQVTISAINRNFPGRGGPGGVWLASPPTVAASAILGYIASFAELIASAD
ncbi:MAG: 3-isopropylmalate dehydratase [Burkholderiales bacterium]|nr:3-isopropylmalate dehydratase [Burkholderiales bacterium]